MNTTEFVFIRGWVVLSKIFLVSNVSINGKEWINSSLKDEKNFKRKMFPSDVNRNLVLLNY